MSSHNRQQLHRATLQMLGYADLQISRLHDTRIKQEGSSMKAWLNSVRWNLAVALGLVEPPRLEPVRVRAPRDKVPVQRRR